MRGGHGLPSFFVAEIFIVNNLDTIVNAIGIAYGILLVLSVFVRNRVTESMRIDALFIKQSTENTRPLNLVVGLLVAGYGIYSLSAAKRTVSKSRTRKGLYAGQVGRVAAPPARGRLVAGLRIKELGPGSLKRRIATDLT